jgi:predicted RNA-binding protein with PIN domain
MYLIDGNNVIGQRPGWHRDKPGSRRRLLEELARFFRVTKTRIAVVFDGAPDRSFPDGSSYCGVKIFYAKPKSNADSRIIEMVEAEKNRNGLIVVTSDGALTSYVRLCGVEVMRSGEFRRMLDGTSTNQSEPPTEVENLAGWLRYFGVDKEEPGEADE